MWCTSRASPVSMTRPTLVRVFSRTRWWWTAAVSSSEGMGAQSAVELRSERTMRLAPSAMASETRRRTLLDGPAQRLAARRGGRARPPGLAHLEEPVDGEGLEARRLAVLVDVHQLGQVVAVDHRQRQQDLAARAAARLEQVGLGADGGRQRGHQLLADGVEGRVGHLGEELGEVVVEQARAVREHRDGRVRAHRAERLGARAGHRGEDDAQLLVRVAEQALLGDDAAVLGREHGAGRELLEADLVGRQPLVVGVLGRQLGLDLLVLDEAALRPCRRGTCGPGCRRPLRTTRSGAMSSTPTSLASTTRPSSVTQ